jgi:hypothetical protein
MPAALCAAALVAPAATAQADDDPVLAHWRDLAPLLRELGFSEAQVATLVRSGGELSGKRPGTGNEGGSDLRYR